MIERCSSQYKWFVYWKIRFQFVSQIKLLLKYNLQSCAHLLRSNLMNSDKFVSVLLPRFAWRSYAEAMLIFSVWFSFWYACRWSEQYIMKNGEQNNDLSISPFLLFAHENVCFSLWGKKPPIWWEVFAVFATVASKGADKNQNIMKLMLILLFLLSKH